MSKRKGAEPKPLPYRKGVGILLFNKKGQVFVAERADAKGAWQMPQGGIDKGETPRQAAKRELFEETGIAKARFLGQTKGWIAYDLPPDLVGKVWKGKYRGQRQKWFAALYLGRDRDIALDAHPEVEFVRWRWVAIGRLPNLIVGFKRPLYEALVAEFTPLAHRLAEAAD
ncbi:MAG: RNA pyrophosphohydrolase [Rhodospirillales bacterium]|nr:RNA pyrophosphohydrolase [Rhodospirillales bacterium]